MKGKYLAYFTLLAGWTWFCYWLISHGIGFAFHSTRADEYPVRTEGLTIPLAFTWGSDIPLAGLGFDAWKQQFKGLDSTGTIVVWKGFYFKDEAETPEHQVDLGLRRVKNVLSFLDLNTKRIMIESIPQEINADVKSNPFVAIAFEKFAEGEVLSYSGDTAQICFPMADSLRLPAISLEKLDRWRAGLAGKKENEIFLVGTADGTGIAESSDIATDRAEMIKDRWIKTGWKEESIHVSTGQRNSPHTLQNRCVVIYFEHDVKQ